MQQFLNRPRATTLSTFLLLLWLSNAGTFGCRADEREELVQAVAQAQSDFDALSPQAGPAVIEALHDLISAKRDFLEFLSSAELPARDEKGVSRSVNSLASSMARLAGLHEQRGEFELAHAVWTDCAKACEGALGVESQSYWDASQEAEAMLCLAQASQDEPDKVKLYFETQAGISKAAKDRDFPAIQALAPKSHQLSLDLFGELAPAHLGQP